MRSSAAWTVAGSLAGLIVASTAGCSNHQSFIVVTLESSGAPIADVDSVTVTVTGGGTDTPVTLTYPGKASTIGSEDAGAGADAGADAGIAGPITLSVSFASGRGGTVKLDVEASDQAHCRIATGTTESYVDKGSINDAKVVLTPHAPLCNDSDSGAGDGGDDVGPFPGCDPAMASTCGAGNTCFVDCKAGKGMCVPAGPAGPGEACPDNNSNCVQGTQCFDYSVTEAQCNVKVCLKFCKLDSDCTSATGVGLGPGSVCKGPVECSMHPTPYKTCTFGCDPRGDGKTGCPTGLACLLVGEHDQVDCRCPAAASVKNEGDICAAFQDCRPGLICTTMGAGSTQRCHKICKTGSAGDCAAGQICIMLANDVNYGICQ
ncbi:MAG TPA: hypothetical protein VNO55_18720 [Polyangia bacterium]|nr:hypothetical protein [Polyangia bacterium]